LRLSKPTTRPSLVLCSATIFDRPLEDKVAAAAAGGFDAITVWPHDYTGARDRGLDDAAIRRLLADHGVVVDGIDCLLDWLPGDQVPELPVFRASEDDLYRVADALGGNFINVAQAFGRSVDVARATELFAAICARAARRDLLVTLEPVPWAGIGKAAVAKEIVTGARAANARLAVDTWGFFRGGSCIEDLGGLGAAAFDNVQLNDGPRTPWADLFAEASDRLLPGDGELAVAAVIASLAAEGFRGPWGIEAPSSLWKDLEAAEIGRRCGAAMRRSLTH
jgi:sugar phosphate isomerase/epimerase